MTQLAPKNPGLESEAPGPLNLAIQIAYARTEEQFPVVGAAEMMTPLE